jgi:hypothetical protein
LIDREKPDTIISFENRSLPFEPGPDENFLFFNQKDSLYTQLLKLPGWKVRVKIIPEKIPGKKKIRIESGGLKVKILKYNPYLYDIATAFKKLGWKGVLERLKDGLIPQKNKPLLLYGGGYNWDHSAKDLKKMKASPIVRSFLNQARWSGSISQEEKEHLLIVWTELKESESFHNFFELLKIDFFPMIEERIRFIVERVTHACIKEFEEAQRKLKSKKIHALIASTFTSFSAHTFSRAANSLNIPIISWQHGAYGYFNQPMIAYNDLMSSEVHLVLGKGVSEKYSPQAKEFKCKIVPIGSATLDSMLQNKSTNNYKKVSGENNVLYITTNFYQNNLYISFSPPFSDNHLWITQKTIIETISRNDGYNLTVKLHPSTFYREPPLKKYSKEEKLKKCAFIGDEIRLIELIYSSDLIVLDFPSTTLLQALTTKNPIFLYAGHLEIDKKALGMLKKRVYCFDNLQDLAQSLDKFLKKQQIGHIDLGNTEFLEHYGVHKLDGKSGERAATIVKETIETREAKRQKNN